MAAAAAPPPLNSTELLRRLDAQLHGLNMSEVQLPGLPTLPAPWSAEELQQRGVKVVGRAPKLPPSTCFLEVAAAELLREAAPEARAAYVVAQRAAVVEAVQRCAVPDADRSDWRSRMAQPGTPFDARALQLWSLINGRGVLVLGADGDFEEVYAPVCADEEQCVCDSITVARLPGDHYAGFAPLEREREQPSGEMMRAQRFGKLSLAAVAASQSAAVIKAANKWFCKGKWNSAEHKYRGQPFIIGNGFFSVTTFHSSVRLGMKCEYMCEVVSSDDTDTGVPQFFITEEDRPDEPLQAKSAHAVWELARERIVEAQQKLKADNPAEYAALPRQAQLKHSSYRHGNEAFGFLDGGYLKRHEDELDPGPHKRFTAYWQFKNDVDEGKTPRCRKRKRNDTGAQAASAQQNQLLSPGAAAFLAAQEADDKGEDEEEEEEEDEEEVGSDDEDLEVLSVSASTHAETSNAQGPAAVASGGAAAAAPLAGGSSQDPIDLC